MWRNYTYFRFVRKFQVDYKLCRTFRSLVYRAILLLVGMIIIR
jgi:hypothetical protein